MMNQRPRTNTTSSNSSSSTENTVYQSEESTTSTLPPPSAPSAASVASYQAAPVIVTAYNSTLTPTSSAMVNTSSMPAYHSQSMNPLSREQELQKVRQEKEIELERLRQDSVKQEMANLKKAPIAINAEDYAVKVAELFNSYNKYPDGTPIPTAVIRNADATGIRIENDEFRLYSRNKVPELVTPKDCATRFELKFAIGQTSVIHGTFKQGKEHFEADGRHVLNVPDGKYAQGFEGPNSSKPFLYGSGTHVITDANFKKAQVLFVDKSNSHIAHGNLHILNVPEGQLAQIILNNKHKRLIPAGEWFFDDNGFKLISNGTQEFINENEPLIKFGPIIRFIPPANHTAVISRNGVLEFFEPAKTQMTATSSGATSGKGTAYEINDPNASFVGFVSKERRDLKLPSEKVIEQNKRSNPKKPEWAEYEQYTSLDNTSLGTKIHCSYSIHDVGLFLSKGNLELLEKEMENYVSTQVANFVRSNKYADFHHVNNTSATVHSDGTNAPLITQMRDSVLRNAENQFAQWGVKFAFISVDAPSILDETLSQQLNQATVETGQLNAEVTRLEAERIKKTKHAEQAKAEAEIKAQQDANVSKIKQEQDSQNKKITAEAEKATAILKAEQVAETSKIEQERDNKNAQTKAETEKKVALIQQEKDNSILQAKAETTKKVSEIDQGRENAIAESKAETSRKVAIADAETSKTKADATEYTKSVAPAKATQAGELVKSEMQANIIKQEITNLTIEADKLKQLLENKKLELDIKNIELETTSRVAITTADNDAYKTKTATAKATAESSLVTEQFKHSILEQEQLNLVEKRKQLALLKETKVLELEVKKIEAEIKLIDIDLDKAQKLADVDVKNQKREKKAELFTKHPSYATYKTTKTNALAWKNGRLVVSPEVSKGYFANNMFTIAAQANPAAAATLTTDPQPVQTTPSLTRSTGQGSGK